MKIRIDIPYSDRENALFDLYLPDGECRSLIIWFHGGGLEHGSRKRIRFAQQLADAGVGCVSVEYRMYPEAGYPAFVEDCAQAVAYILMYRENLGIPKKIYISGKSAGAWITLMLAMNPAWLENAGVDRTAIAGFISDSAQVTTHFNVLRERGMDTRLERIDEAAPLFWLTEDCPVDNLLLIWYNQDMPCRPEQNKLLLRALTRFFPNRNIRGVELQGGHGAGSSVKNERGNFDYVEETLRFIG